MFNKFRERGLAIIPIHRGRKNPVLEKWSDFCTRLPTEAEAEDWDQRFKGFNIGVTLGAASNLIALDIDTDDKRILDACPTSPVCKVGKKGETRFFRYNPEISTRSWKFPWNPDDGIEVLSGGKQTVLPHSIHPDTGLPYKWTTIDTLENFDINDLPIFTSELFQIVERLATQERGLINGSPKTPLSGIFQSPDRVYPHGAQGRLKTLCTTLLLKGLTIDAAAEELLKYDSEHHKPSGYFSAFNQHSDAKTPDAKTNAIVFCANNLKSFNASRMKNGEAPVVSSAPLVINFKEKPHVSAAKKKYPEARGIMKTFQEACELKSFSNQEALSLGGALSLMSVLCANRFRSKVGSASVTSNLYILNIADSGAGKEVCQAILSELLGETELLGASLYRSGSSMVKFLPKQQERLDLIDEASSLLKAMNSREDYKREMIEILSSLFSKAGTMFEGITSATDGMKQGAVYNPSVSVLASTTPIGFKDSVSKAMSEKGLMPRFIAFYQKNLGDLKIDSDSKLFDEKMECLRGFIEAILSSPKLRASDFNPPKNYLAKHQSSRNEDLTKGTRYAPTVVNFSQAAMEAFSAYRAQQFETLKSTEDHFTKAFIARFAELAAKLAMLDAISLDRRVIEADSVAWGVEVIEAQWDRMRSFYEETSGENLNEAYLLKIKAVIREAGTITNRDLNRKTTQIDKRTRDMCLSSLVEAEFIQVCEIKHTNGRMVRGFQWI